MTTIFVHTYIYEYACIIVTHTPSNARMHICVHTFIHTTIRIRIHTCIHKYLYTHAFIKKKTVISTFVRIKILLTAMGPNIARGGVVTQSSTYTFWILRSKPKRAIDGELWDTERARSCSQTNADYAPWWKITFKHNFLVKKVVIVNRGDCCGT